MRSEVELLKLLRDNLNSDLFKDSLCHLIDDMMIGEIINSKEKFFLRRLLYDNSPYNPPYNNRIGNYWWGPYKREPRDKFLQELIEKYKDD